MEGDNAKSGAAKTIKFRDVQKILISKQGAICMSVLETCRPVGIGQTTYHDWKNKCNGLLPAEIKPL
jgi:hypothetical protein